MNASLDAADQAPTYAVGKSTIAASKGRRLDGVDAARGVAMALVCLSHFMRAYVSLPPTGLNGHIGSLTLVASPTFIALRGVMLGMRSLTWAVSKKVNNWPTLVYVPLENNYEYVS